MKNWYLAYNPATKEGCYLIVHGPVASYGEAGYLAQDCDLIFAFLQKNGGYPMLLSAQDELYEQLHAENGVIVNRLQGEERKAYINYAMHPEEYPEPNKKLRGRNDIIIIDDDDDANYVSEDSK